MHYIKSSNFLIHFSTWEHNVRGDNFKGSGFCDIDRLLYKWSRACTVGDSF